MNITLDLIIEVAKIVVFYAISGILILLVGTALVDATPIRNLFNFLFDEKIVDEN